MYRKIIMNGVENLGYIEDLRKIVGHRPLILTGAVAVIVNYAGEILLQQRKYPKGYWGLPGGLMELGESAEETAKREVFEETRLKISRLQLLNVYSGPDYFVTAENGDQFYMVTIAYYTEHFEGDLFADPEESVALEFFKSSCLPERIICGHFQIIKDFLDGPYKKNEKKT